MEKIVQSEKILFLGECVAGIIHQIKHPLSTISAQVKMIEHEKFYPKQTIAFERIKKLVFKPSKGFMTITTYIGHKNIKYGNSKDVVVLDTQDMLELKEFLSEINF